MVHLENRIIVNFSRYSSMLNTLLSEYSVFGRTCVITVFSQINFSSVSLFSLGSPFSESCAENKKKCAVKLCCS